MFVSWCFLHVLFFLKENPRLRDFTGLAGDVGVEGDTEAWSIVLALL